MSLRRKIKMAITKKSYGHSPAGKEHLKRKRKKKKKEKTAKQLKKVTSMNYYGGKNQQIKTADELLKEIKIGKR